MSYIGVDFLNLEEIIKKELKKVLKEKRYNHVLGVQDTSIKMANFFGESSNNASLAALLHDFAKEMPKKEKFKFAVENKMKIDKLEENEIELIHGAIASIQAQNIFEVRDENILNSIKFHTTGRKFMSNLEKIIYIADFIEPSRNYEGVEELRNLAFFDLDKALLKAFDNSINYIILQKKPIHKRTIEARNWILQEIKIANEVKK